MDERLNKELEYLLELYTDELARIRKKGELTPAENDAACKALTAIEKIVHLMGKDNQPAEYSNRMSYMLPEIVEDYSERRGRNMRNGQYMSRRNEVVNNAITELEDTMSVTPDDRVKKHISRCIRNIELESY